MSSAILPVLSTQQIASCSTSDAGCNGGDTVSAYSYMMSAGVQSDSSYQYTSGSTGMTGSCQYNANDVVSHISGWQYGVAACGNSDPSCSMQASLEPNLKQVIATQGPASVCLNATPWQYYVSGVLATTCASDLNSMNHCLQLVGYNTSTDGSQYWILRNQWGTQWGINGFIYLKMGTNLCGVTNEVTYATVPAGPTPTPTPIPTPLPPGQQEVADFNSTHIGKQTTCSVSNTSGIVVTCRTSLSTDLVSKSVPSSQLSQMLQSKVTVLENAVIAIRPIYYRSLKCELASNQTEVRYYNRTQKYMIGTLVFTD